MFNTVWLVDLNKLAKHTGEEDVVMFWLLVYVGEPFDAMSGDLDVDLA